MSESTRLRAHLASEISTTSIGQVDHAAVAVPLWRGLPRLLELRYEVCAFRMDDAIAAIKMHLGLRGPAWPVRVYAGRVAFTHRNKAVPERHVAELGAAERASLDVAFAPYLDAMGYRRLTPSAP